MQLSKPPTPTLYLRLVRPMVGALLVTCLALPVALCVLVIAALQLAIQRSLGGVFFVQERAGLHGRPFRILKFRTLEPGADGALRATGLGALLRKSHLDELPQLWNVVRGEMSLIGPRPEALDVEAWANARVPGFSGRLCVRPGITGWAQVVQDSTPAVEADYREKLRLNLEYLKAMGPAMDLEILVRTALRPLRPRAFAPGPKATAQPDQMQDPKIPPTDSPCGPELAPRFATARLKAG